MTRPDAAEREDVTEFLERVREHLQPLREHVRQLENTSVHDPLGSDKPGGTQVVADENLAAMKAPQKIHQMPTSAVAFAGDLIVTVSTDFTFNIMPIGVGFSLVSFMLRLAQQLLVFAVLAFILVDYLI